MSHPWQIRQAVRALSAGGVIAYPTETVFGLGCDPLNQQAVERILELKQRPVEKGLIIIGATLEQLRPYIDIGDISDPAQLQKLTQPAERPTTWICPMHRDVPQWLHGKHNTIAIRITSSPLVQALCNEFGNALVSTSANPAGLEPARTTQDIERYFDNQLDYILDGQCDPDAQPSRIVDLVSGRVIRE